MCCNFKRPELFIRAILYTIFCFGLIVPAFGQMTFTSQVISDSDDAEQQPFGQMELGSSDLELIADGLALQTIGIRFTDIPIPQGSTIQNAYIQFTTDETSSAYTFVTIRGQAADNATTFTNANYNISSRPTTSLLSATNWTIPAWNTVGQKHNSPDISGVIQEITDRPGWVKGNDLAIIITGVGSRTAESHNGESELAPKLFITIQEDIKPCYAIRQSNNGELFAWYEGGGQYCIGTLGKDEVETVVMNGACDQVFTANEGEFGELDLNTGEFIFTSDLGIINNPQAGGSHWVNDVDGMAIDHISGYIYATERISGSNDLLFIIDPTTGEPVKNAFGPGKDYVQIPGPNEDIDDISFNPCTDELYGISTVSGNTSVNDIVVKIDILTGQTTTVVQLPECDSEGLTFNNNCQLFVSTGHSGCVNDGSIFEVDLSDGSLTEITHFGGDVEATVCCVDAPLPSELACSIIQTIDVCGNGTAEAQAIPSGGVGGYTYQWSHGPTTPVASNLTNGNYTITVSDFSGDYSTCSITIASPCCPDDGPDFQCEYNLNNTGWVAGNCLLEICEGDNLQYSYPGCNSNWQIVLTGPNGFNQTGDPNCGNILISNSITLNMSGTYVATVTDLISGCSSSVEFEIVVLEIEEEEVEPCAFNLLTNPSFETGDLTGWSTNGNPDVSMSCHSMEGDYILWIGPAGSSVWQDVSGEAGTTFTLDYYDGAHVVAGQTVSMIFLDINGNEIIRLSDDTTYDVDEDCACQLNGHTLSGVAPPGTATVRVEGYTPSDGFKLDAFCLTNTCNGSITGVYIYDEATDAPVPGIGALTNGQQILDSDLPANYYLATELDGNMQSVHMSVNGVGQDCENVAPYTYPNFGDSGTPWNGGVGLHTVVADAYRFTDCAAEICDAQSFSFSIVNCTYTCSTTLVSDASCFGYYDGSASVLPNGGTSPYTYRWDNGETNALATQLNAGTRSVTVTDVNDCSSICTVLVGEPTDISFTINSFTYLECEDDSDGSVSITASGGQAPYTYAMEGEGSNSTGVFSGLSYGYYPITITDNDGCQFIGGIHMGYNTCNGLYQNIEMFSGAGNPTTQGPTTAAQVVTFQENTNDPTGNTAAVYTPAITATYALTSQQYTSIPSADIGTQSGMNFGARNNSSGGLVTPEDVYGNMNVPFDPTDDMFTSAADNSPGTGIDLDVNQAILMYNTVKPLQYAGLPVDASHFYGELVITFSEPVNYPLLHFVGLGGFFEGELGRTGYTTDFELSAPGGVTMREVSGNRNFDVVSNTVFNSSINPNSLSAEGAASGTVVIDGVNIVQLRFNVSMRGVFDTNYFPVASQHTGDALTIGISLLTGEPESCCKSIFSNGFIRTNQNFIPPIGGDLQEEKEVGGGK